MKKPLKKSQVFALLSFAAFPIILTFFNFSASHKIIQYPTPEKSNQAAKPLSGKIITRTTYFEPSKALTIDINSVDSVLLLPSKRDYVTIIGDSLLLDNIKAGNIKEYEGIYLRHRWWYENANDEGKQTNVVGAQTTKVKVIVGYSVLKSINISQPLKAFIQKGVLKGENIHIDVVSDLANLNVEANYLNISLLKPDHLPKGDTISTSRMKGYVQDLKKDPIHQVKGKADLIMVRNYSGNHLHLDLAHMQCRQVFVELNTTSYNKVIASPRQLFSSTLVPNGFFNAENELICLSKAKVVHAYRTSKGILRYR